MFFLLLAWGFEYVVVKVCLNEFYVAPLTLVFMKYLIALIILVAIKLARDRRLPFRKKDILPIAFCALCGDIFYFFGEYTALTMLKISTVTILLAFVPVVSMLIEIAIYKKLPTVLMVAMAAVSIVGVALVCGEDVKAFFSGKLIGFLCVILAVLSWNVYNFITDRLTERHKPFDLTLLQLASALVLCAPAIFVAPPPAAAFSSPLFFAAVIYLGVFSSCICFLIYVKSISIIGATSASMFSNFLPVTSSFFGFVALGESLTIVQVLGGVIVVASGVIFIREKGKVERMP
jgi:drug/metabolite transporter (DMT)-like permease